MAAILYRGTPDSELIYTGDDEIVWDRINQERLRRGLPGLAAIGIPRPVPETVSNDTAVPGAVTGLPFANNTAAERLAISNLEAQRDQLIQSTSALESQVYANQQILNRKALALANTTDPNEARALAQEVAGLQSSITSQTQRVESLTKQVGQLDTNLAQAASNALGSLPGGLSVPAVPSLAALDQLKSLPVGLPINPAQVLKTDPATLKIPGLDQAQLTGLLSSTVAAVKKIPGLGNDLLGGLGKFGASPEQLTQQGLLKPGIVQKLSATPEITEQDLFEAERITSQGGDITPEQVARNRQLNQTLSSPFAWTGKNGVTDLASFDASDSLQSVVQQDIVKSGLDQLKELGTITGNEGAEQLGSLAQSAAKFGPAAVDLWTKGKAPPEIGGLIAGVAKDAQFAVNLVDNQLPDLGSIPATVEGAVGTVDRASVDAAFANILGSPKISLPSFGSAAAVEGALYANTRDEDLLYTGDDNIVWDRVNAERLKRGLPGLAAIGYPRPPDDESGIQA
jgi:hypothetical protein